MKWRRRLGWLGVVAVLAAGVFGVLRVYTVASVAGGSMVPALLPADIAIVRRTPEVEAGQIALLLSPSGTLFLHRVVGVGASGSARTKGDANEIEDFEVTPPDRIVGPVVAYVPAGTVLERWRHTRLYATLTAQSNSTRQ